MKKWVVGAMLLLAAALIVPWWVGKHTQQQWEAAIASLNLSPEVAQVATRQYDRGWFQSEVNGELTLTDPEDGQSHTIDWQGRITHGIIGSRITVQPVFERAFLNQAVFPGEKPQLTISSVFWGDASVELFVPAIHYENPSVSNSVHVSALEADMGVTDAGSQMLLELDWPGMVVESADLRARVDNFRMTQSARRIGESLWGGAAGINLGAVRIEPRTGPGIRVQALEIQGDSGADEAGTRFDSRTSFRLQSLRVGDRENGPHRFDMTLDGLHVPSWDRLMAAVDEVNRWQAGAAGMDPATAQQQQMQMMREFSAAAKALAGAGLELGVSDLNLETPSGAVTGNLTLAHPELPKARRDDMPLVVQQLTGDVQLSLPAALLDSNPALAGDAAGLVEQGFLSQRGDRYHLDGRLRDMMLTVNGKEIPIPPLL